MFNKFNNNTNSTNDNYMHSKSLTYVDGIIIFIFFLCLSCFCTSIHYSRRWTKNITINVVKLKINN